MENIRQSALRYIFVSLKGIQQGRMSEAKEV